jgi:hypothetical protein
MNPVQRIGFGTEIARRLRDRDWREVNYTLSQVGLPTGDWDDGDFYGYVLRSLKDASDDALIKLGEVVGYHEIGIKRNQPVFWKDGWVRAFISHVSEKKIDAHSLKISLERYGIHGFVAHDDIEPTKEWQDEIESALRTMDVFIALLTPNFVNSKWCDQEVGFALGLRTPFVAVSCGALSHGFLSKVQVLKVDLANANVAAEKIFGVLKKNEQLTQKLGCALVSRIEVAGSFDEANRISKIILDHPKFDARDIDRLERLPEKNSQVAGAFEFASALKAAKSRATTKVPT